MHIAQSEPTLVYLRVEFTSGKLRATRYSSASETSWTWGRLILPDGLMLLEKFESESHGKRVTGLPRVCDPKPCPKTLVLHRRKSIRHQRGGIAKIWRLYTGTVVEL